MTITNTKHANLISNFVPEALKIKTIYRLSRIYRNSFGSIAKLSQRPPITNHQVIPRTFGSNRVPISQWVWPPYSLALAFAFLSDYFFDKCAKQIQRKMESVHTLHFFYHIYKIKNAYTNS